MKMLSTILSALIKQLGLNVNEIAREIANQGNVGPFAPDFKNSKPKRIIRKSKTTKF